MERSEMMTPAQLKYARERVDAALREKIAVLSDQRDGKFGEKQRLSALKRGAFTINKRATCLSEAIVYPEAPREMPWDEYKKRSRELEEEAGRIKDELILGDHQEALKLIRKFKGA